MIHDPLAILDECEPGEVAAERERERGERNVAEVALPDPNPPTRPTPGAVRLASPTNPCPTPGCPNRVYGRGPCRACRDKAEAQSDGQPTGTETDLAVLALAKLGVPIRQAQARVRSVRLSAPAPVADADVIKAALQTANPLLEREKTMSRGKKGTKTTHQCKWGCGHTVSRADAGCRKCAGLARRKAGKSPGRPEGGPEGDAVDRRKVGPHPVFAAAPLSPDLPAREAEIRRACEEIADLLVAKNRAYGDSALAPIRCFSRSDPIEGLKVRLDDKLSRLMRGEAAGEDVELDLVGYLVLLRIARKAAARA